MPMHDLRLTASDLAALRLLVGAHLIERQSVHPWFANAWEGSLRMDLITDDHIISVEGVFDSGIIDGLADQLLRLTVKTGTDVRPWTLFGNQGRERRRNETLSTPWRRARIDRVRIVREEVRVETIDGTSLLELTLDLGVLLTFGQSGDESSLVEAPHISLETYNYFVGPSFDQHEPTVKWGSSPKTMFRFGIHTYPGAVNWFLEPGQRLLHSRSLIELDEAEAQRA